MKSLSLLSTGSVCLALLACSTAADPPPSSGGAGSGNTGNTAGAPPQGGAGAPQGGAAPQGGSGTSAGSDAGGTGGTDVTAGGNTAGGAAAVAGAAGSPTAGAGGAPPVAGAGGGPSGGSGAIDPVVFTNGWDGALLQYPCSSKGQSVDCPNDSACVSVKGQNKPSYVVPAKLNGATTPSTWTIAGDPGKMYDVHLLIRGVVEAYNYVGGTIDKTSGTPNTRQDLFGKDGSPQNNADTTNGSDYNSYILTVTPTTGAAKTYMLNAVPNTENPHTSNLTQHRSFPITEDKHIIMAGGSKVTLDVGDSNCVEIMNCGDQAGGSCTSPWTVSLANSTPPIPKTGTFTQPFSANGSFGQWVAFEVLGVVAQ